LVEDLRVPLPRWEELVTGALVGVVELVDCLPASEITPSPFVEGPVCRILENPRPFPEAVTWRGIQGLFSASDEVFPREF
jgi:hypothetical protein